MNIPKDTKPMIWGAVIGAAACAILGFTWGGWVTGGTARAMAAAAATGGRDEIVAAICVDHFQAGRDAHGQLAALKELQSWSRGSFIEKGGWATMPGQGKPTGTAARLCADQLVAL